jgi:glycosyltransferase involved in cell wall biosynthesis
MSRLKILHIITRFIVGGAQENTLLTCKGLMSRGHRVLLATGPQTGPEGSLFEKAKADGVDIKIIPHMIREINPFYDLLAYKELFDLIKHDNFNVVHTHSSKAGILGRIAAKKCGCPIIVHTIHGLAFHRFENPVRNLLYKKLERYVGRFADRIITVGDVMKQKALSAALADENKFVTIYSGIELDEFLKIDEGSKSVRKRLGIPMDALVIGKIARLVELKGHNYIIKCAKEISDRFPNVYFLFIGGGYLKDKIKEQIKQMGLKQRFIFTGLVSPSDVPQLIGAMDMLVHTSLREGLPRTIPQALACGKPVVAFDIDGAGEIVQDGITGHLVKAEDTEGLCSRIIDLLKNSDLRKSMGQKGREFVKQRFDVRIMVDRIEEEYKKIVDSR